MAVKLRSSQLGVAVDYIDAKGKTKKKDLSALIDQVCSMEKEKGLREQLHSARQLRNYYAHPDKHNFMGGTVRQANIPLVNVINLLFLDLAVVTETNGKLEQLKKQYCYLRKGFWGVEVARRDYFGNTG